ncbi:hypothetical protein Ahy_B03g061976 isoform B [Arachis hypogaea]|uniref:Uncharacterized protein n=1 Tax=Arachis hypogaea TaxID=3818 RepID=A0A444ZSL3_ARAHY|nr:hypothetical protein Ahy_B03g061976 isoform B [Arachis hypogaea]
MASRGPSSKSASSCVVSFCNCFSLLATSSSVRGSAYASGCFFLLPLALMAVVVMFVSCYRILGLSFCLGPNVVVTRVYGPKWKASGPYIYWAFIAVVMKECSKTLPGNARLQGRELATATCSCCARYFDFSEHTKNVE